jgi:hypothetical protein
MAGQLAAISTALLAPLKIVSDRVTPSNAVARSVEELSPDRLGRALRLPTGSVISTDVRHVDHGTSLRVCVDVHLANRSFAVFTKLTPVRAAARLFNIATSLCEHEVHFYRHLAAQSGCAPVALAALWHAPTGRSTLVMPDMRDEGFEFIGIADQCSTDRAALTVEALARLHRRFWNSRRFDGAVRYLPESSIATVGTPLLCAYFGSNPDRIAERLPDGFAEDAHILRTHARAMFPLFQSFDQTLLHNDSHLGNVAYASDRAVLVDWQVCSIGSAIKDIAYFLCVSLDPDVRRATERDLLLHYLDVLSSGDGPNIVWDDAWTAYRVLAVTGYISAATTALFGDRLQSAANTNTGLHRAATALVDLDSFRAVRERLSA